MHTVDVLELWHLVEDILISIRTHVFVSCECFEEVESAFSQPQGVCGPLVFCPGEGPISTGILGCDHLR